ncbi:carbohydrate-binding protein [Arthrobacter polaris]|uniref:carbohydrate-binding protein n=1 Tax=Arthrobacter polaris TaxID=2813727 RepID=UPI003D7EB6EF
MTSPLAEPSASASPLASSQATVPADNPATSPYPIWSDLAVYVEGDRIVWHGNVYTAKWWTQDDVPDNPVATEGLTPWQLVGPVLPGDKPAPQQTVPAGTYPLWTAEKIYLQGDRVMFDSRIFEAKWWNREESPLAAMQGSPSSAWKMFTNDQAQQLLAPKAS